ncbi:hypothetical protein RB2150_13901 [Rhodobacteraceae bacterium HTCC2150]|nr:hypothetical protein RB2150_13901 [Rhodobacteraceae bacterium HTCC2150]
MNEQMVCVGAIGGSYGVKGDARIKSFVLTHGQLLIMAR